MRKLVGGAALVGLFVIFTAGVAVGGGQVVLTIEPTSGPPGTVITATVQTCDSGSESMRLELINPSGQVVADTGFFQPTGVTFVGEQGTITVPEGSPPGTYTVRVTCNNLPPDLATDTAPFEVTGQPASPAPAAPPQPAPAEPVIEGPVFTG
jgi:hypothetical protein